MAANILLPSSCLLCYISMINCFSGLSLYLTLKALGLSYLTENIQSGIHSCHNKNGVLSVNHRTHKPLTVVGVATNM